MPVADATYTGAVGSPALVGTWLGLRLGLGLGIGLFFRHRRLRLVAGRLDLLALGDLLHRLGNRLTLAFALDQRFCNFLLLRRLLTLHHLGEVGGGDDVDRQRIGRRRFQRIGTESQNRP